MGRINLCCRSNGGLQGVLLTGTGPSNVTLIHRPTGLRAAIGTSLVSIAAAICVMLVGLVKTSVRPSTANHQVDERILER